jgi:hypothetical protein
LKLNIRRTSGLLAAAALLGIIPGTFTTAQALTARPATGGERTVGTMRVVVVGLPHTIKRGTTTSVTIWYTQNSRFRLTPVDFAFYMWASRSTTYSNIWVNWLNPISKRWQSSSWLAGGDHVFTFPPTSPSIAPNHWARIDAKIYVGKHAELGKWNVDALPSYQTLGHWSDGSVGVLNMQFTEYSVNVVR